MNTCTCTYRCAVCSTEITSVLPVGAYLHRPRPKCPNHEADVRHTSNSTYLFRAVDDSTGEVLIGSESRP